MGQLLSRERLGRPQFLAALLLLAFLLQAVWLVSSRQNNSPRRIDEAYRVSEGVGQWSDPRQVIAGTPGEVADSPRLGIPAEIEKNSGYDPNHSPLWYLLAAAPFAVFSVPTSHFAWNCLQALPQLAFGLLLGASLWYVARRLYGNAGGYIALSLYCFAPGVIRSSTVWLAEPEMGAAWGTFGAIFTAVAVSHTLYAPREVILWNWRRITLLALSFALAIGCQFSLVITLPVALLLMLYLAPTRRIAALAIWSAAVVLSGLLLFASYSFHPGVFWQGLSHAEFFSITPQALGMPAAYIQVLSNLGQISPALLLAIPFCVAAYAVSKRIRYFGNTAPLLIAMLLLALAVPNPHYPGLGFQLMAVPFLFVFVAGVAADLLETRHRAFVQAGLCGLLGAYGLRNILQLARI